MNGYRSGCAALVLGVLSAGCDDFLSGPGLTEDPNNPIDASTTAQFVAMQANMFVRLQGQLARFGGIYTQQLMGSNNQQLQWATRYGVVEGDISGQMAAFYTGAGLRGLRNVQEDAREAGDAQWEGIAKIWEAYAFGTAMSIWGDLPYSEANNPDIATPRLDTQQELYTAVLALLDEGIGLLDGPGPGPAEADLIYGGNVDRWRRAAYTLMARFHLHLVERQGVSAYQAAIAAANNGINEPPADASTAMHGQAPGDFRALHGATTAVDANIWSQFLAARQDVVAGNALVATLRERDDHRLAAYFNPNQSGDVVGMNQDEQVVGSGAASVVDTRVRRVPTFRQPFVTWAENELILAEAKHATGDGAGALEHVNSVRTAVGMPALGEVSFEDVALEKYIAMFQNIEVWNDWKRTCIPLLKPHGNNAEVPGRLPYGSAERVENPNLPLPSDQPARNWNDPEPCPRP